MQLYTILKPTPGTIVTKKIVAKNMFKLGTYDDNTALIKAPDINLQARLRETSLQILG